MRRGVARRRNAGVCARPRGRGASRISPAA